MTQAALEEKFVGRVREMVVSLPYDLKVLFEVMSDEDISPAGRRTAAGAVIYCLSPSDPIPDTSGIVGFVDDAVLLRLVLRRILEVGGDGVESYPQRFVEQFSTLEQDLQLIKDYLGDSIDWLMVRLEKMTEIKYKGKSVATYLDDDGAFERLYQDGMAFTTDYEIDDEKAQRLSSGAPVLDAFRKRQDIEASRA